MTIAGIIDVLSNNSDVPFTPERLRVLAQFRTGVLEEVGFEAPASFRVHKLSRRLGDSVVDEIVRRYQDGESATSLAKEHGVAPSALLNLMREQKVVVRKRFISTELAAQMAEQYQAGATVAELQATHGRSHNAVLRALKSAGVVMRPAGRRLSH